jgi:crossover junction endodeoxyribonuclease RuvC
MPTSTSGSWPRRCRETSPERPDPREKCDPGRRVTHLAPPGGLTVVGIDPGTTATGYGVVSRAPGGRLTLLECGVVRTTSKAPLPDRIREIFEEIEGVLDRFRPLAVSVEAVFQGKNVRSALVLGHARGAILLAASLRELEIHEYSPREIKKAVVGNGNATKDQVGFMVRERLRLQSAPKPSDAADGVAAALCHFVIGVDGRATFRRPGTPIFQRGVS